MINSHASNSDVSAWGGIFPASLTMFTEAGDLDIDGTVGHISSLIDQGAHGIVLAGTSGEFISLTPQERVELTREVAAAIAGRVPLIVGTGAFSTRETTELTVAMAEAGADAALVILPYYQRPHREEVLEHFRAVARDSGAPIFVYNNPTNSGTDPLSGDELAQLESEANVVGVKSTFPTVHQVYEAAVATSPAFRTFYGGFTAPIEGLAGGACGWISGILNVAVPAAVALHAAVSENRLDDARAIWRERLLPIRFVYTKGLLGPVNDLELYRSILRLRGLPAGHSRRPLLPLTSDQVSRLRDELVARDLL